MHWQLARIPGANAANQPQRPANEALGLARAIKLVVGDKQLRVAGRLKLRLEPCGVEQQRIQPLALVRLGEVMREAAVEVATRPFIRPRVDRAFKRCDQRLVLRDEPLFPCPIAQEVTDRIVEPKEPLSEIEIEQQRQI